MSIRLLNSDSNKEILLVANRMKKTLIDVMGRDKGADYYSEEWLLDRVKYHIDLKKNARIFLSEESSAEISGQAIVRIEKENGEDFGFFSTIYVADEFRGKGVAKELIGAVINWCQNKGLKRITYNTAENHMPIISLFEKFNFKEILRSDGMLKLACFL